MIDAGSIAHSKRTKKVIADWQGLQRSLWWYAFFMAFPTILFVQNISIYIFPFVILAAWKLVGFPFSYRHWIQIVVLLFGIAALLSVLNMPNEMRQYYYAHSLYVLPNYIYWCILVWFLISVGPFLNLAVVARGICVGLLLTLIYYFIAQDAGITGFAIFKRLTQNTFAFILICFSPVAVLYIKERYGWVSTIIVAIILVLAGFLGGSRSSSMLVLSGIAMVLFYSRFSAIKVTLVGVVLLPLAAILLNTDLVRDLIRNLNPRTYELIYDTEKVVSTDRSYLVRLAMVEKGIEIYKKHPYTGVGLNNFTNYSVRIPGEFEGARLIKNKRGLNDKSAHNSYVGILAEGGLFLFIPFVTLILICVLFFTFRSSQMSSLQKAFFVCLIHMAVHLYFIMAIVNVFAWFVIGVCLSIMVKGVSK